MNYNNMINQIQQQLNQINNIYQEINTIKNQINTMNMDINSINFNNKLSLNNNIINNNGKINVNFRQNLTDPKGPSFMVKCHFFENISTLIRKYRNKSGDYSCNKAFIFNAKRLNIYSPLTIEELGITNDSNIFVVNHKPINNEIDYRFLNDDIHVKFYFCENSKISNYLYSVVRFNFVLNSSDIINYIYNSKKVDKDYIIKESEVKDNSEIIIKLNKQSVYFINVTFKELYDEETTKIKCLNKEKISSIIRRFKVVRETDYYLRFLIKTKEIDESDNLKLKMADLTVEDFGLDNNSIIFYQVK